MTQNMRKSRVWKYVMTALLILSMCIFSGMVLAENDSNNIELAVIDDGDVNRDGAVDLEDGIYLVKHALHVAGYEEMVEEVAADTNGDKMADIDDGIYLINHALKVPGYENASSKNKN
ncbi:MAG: hypothetical protein SVM80_06820 [Halobacteriota archaeon]|nr:hypothetical protein [Halobacteriota archaeon]